MVVSLKNIGPINEATFDLDKDLIVFIGPNNSGKTYAVNTIYSIIKNTVPREEIPVFDNQTKLSDGDIENLFNNGFAHVNLKQLFEGNVDVFSKNHLRYVKNELEIDFWAREGFFDNTFLNITFNNKVVVGDLFKAKIEYSVKYGKNVIEFKKEKGSPNLTIIIHTNSGDDLLTNSQKLKQYPIDFSEAKSDSTASYVIHALLPGVLTKIILPIIYKSAFIFPAERVAINIFNGRLSSNVDSPTYKQLYGNLKPFPKPIRDSIDIADRLSDISKLKSDLAFVAKEFETKIFNGSVNVSSNGELLYSPMGGETILNIHLSAGMIKSLSSLVLYLKHMSAIDDLIIIDEPEINLHPDNQRLVARILAKLSKVGVKVIVSTHSDYFIRELNNLIMLNKEHPETIAMREKYGYDESEILDHNRVGAYLFKDHTATPIEVTEVGMEAATIDEEINKLNNASNDIYWTLFEE